MQLGTSVYTFSWVRLLRNELHPFPVRNPSSAGMMVPYNHQTKKPIFPTSSDVFSNAWLDLFRPWHIWAYHVGVYWGESTRVWRVWAGEVSDFHGGNFTQNWIRNWNSWCCSWSYSNSCKLSSCFHVISPWKIETQQINFVLNIQRIPIKTWINTSHETMGLPDLPKGWIRSFNDRKQKKQQYKIHACNNLFQYSIYINRYDFLKIKKIDYRIIQKKYEKI